VNTSANWFLLSSTDHLIETDSIDLDDFVTNSGDISIRTAHAASNTFNHHLIVFIDEIDGSITWGKSGQLVSTLDQ
jgi:hypothetical protein